MKEGKPFDCDYRKKQGYKDIHVVPKIINGKEICPHTKNYACKNIINCSFYSTLFESHLSRRDKIMHACDSYNPA